MKISEKVNHCQNCNNNQLDLVLDLGSQPPANSLRLEDQKKLPLIDLKLIFCRRCKLLQLSEIVDPKYLFNNYLWVSGTSNGAKTYSKIFCDLIIRKLCNISLNKNYILELASNDGTFLKEFSKKGYNVLGVDPAQNIAKIANKDGIRTIPKFFNKKLAENILKNDGHPSVVIARNVIPHVKEIKSILDGISILLNEKNLGVIEFHYSKTILEELHYDSIYHEHIFYFSIFTLNNFLNNCNLYIYDYEKSPISGGSLVIFFSKVKKTKSQKLIEAENYEMDKGINSLERWKLFAKNSITHAQKLKEMILNKKKQGLVIGFGASARSSTILNFCGINNNQIDFIIDKNNLKKDMITPGSDIKILSLKDSITHLDKISCIIILAWNFEKEIHEELLDIGYKGSVIVPLPYEPKIYEV